MEVVELCDFVPPCKGLAVSLGFFDGIHIGHQKIIEESVTYAQAHDMESAFFTFSDHPHGIITPGNKPRMLSTFEEKKALVSELGIDYFIWTDFTDAFRAIPAMMFVEEILKKKMNARAICAGPNYHFGHNAEGNAEMLQSLGKEQGISVTIPQPVHLGDEMVASTLIRKYLSEGNLEKAALMLGRPYSVMGSFRHDNEPLSASLWTVECEREKVMPQRGVYGGKIIQPKETHGTLIYTGVYELSSYLAVSSEIPFNGVNGDKLCITFTHLVREFENSLNRVEIDKDLEIDRKLQVSLSAEHNET